MDEDETFSRLKYRVRYGPAGTCRYYDNDDEQHREDGPAVIWKDGSKEWWIHGELHREDGPAMEYADGSYIWYKKGVIHREDGPAILLTDGTYRWIINGTTVTEERFMIELK